MPIVGGQPAGIDDAMPETIRIAPSRPASRRSCCRVREEERALSIALRDEVSDAIDVLAGDDSVKVIVITGAGNVFSAGFDLGSSASSATPITPGGFGTRATDFIPRCCGARSRRSPP
jgi:hypothetical protein